MRNINSFLNQLDNNKIFYQLNKIRSESIMVTVVVPGQRWEIEFLEDGAIEIEKFISDGIMYGEDEIAVLFKKFSD